MILFLDTLSAWTRNTRSGRRLGLVLAIAGLGLIPGAFAQEVGAPAATGAPDNGEIQRFCSNIADGARDQRYVLQKKQLEDLQTEVNGRIAELEKRRNEYQDWLKRRNDFLEQAQVGLVGIYKGMAPDAAAAKLQEVNPEIAAALIMKLPPKKSSLILAEMASDKAAVITAIIASATDPKTSKEPS
ncbi:flagellar protein [Xaviernesmea oryzae]|uniref:Flagellar protein n=1 Tax=Xaviernesmea oryzae TaxID=464029 RepID=A0A1Q9AS42_9HYPH|nr:MotE family protein [Xaviernesmea oryzae]OLP58186.1 flagellar protein [Xaviernesmea oryzae]SEL47444.1 Flagellar motility protein MotE, a chaperone for MotC folding [Xaviernesmea oryzae]